MTQIIYNIISYAWVKFYYFKNGRFKVSFKFLKPFTSTNLLSWAFETIA